MQPSIFGRTMRSAHVPKLFHDCFETPVGMSDLVCDEEGRLLLYGWYELEAWRKSLPDEVVTVTDPFGLRGAFHEYFAGTVDRLECLAVLYRGTPFQTRVWQALRSIPPGETLSYGGLARRLGEPKAMRAVGLANGANPIALVVPCHRVIGSDGSLTGYGGGLERKKWLLTHEARHAGSGLFAPRRQG